MRVIHLSAECYPVAKVGGLGDVAGALPKYQRMAGVEASVLMPFYDRKFTQENAFSTVYTGEGRLGNRPFKFSVLKEVTDKLGFPLYMVHIPGLLDRPEVYAYNDETEQFVAFQIAALDWLLNMEVRPDVIHCHDHHTGLVPFMLSTCVKYRPMVAIPTVVTVHNGQYQGWFGWEKLSYIPEFDLVHTGLLSWGGSINPLAAAIKCCWKFTTVSPGYLEELTLAANGLENLFAEEIGKGAGIINGIDVSVWNPKTDPMIHKNYAPSSAAAGKMKNKELLLAEFVMDAEKPLLAFIGRLVGEKGADILPELFSTALDRHPELNIFVLGSGESHIEDALKDLNSEYTGRYYADIGYNEILSHCIYAAADFLIMPSRVEPCGLNQLYSMRYGTIPVVRSTGGLKDTVPDISGKGYGICFDEATPEDALRAIDRSIALYTNRKQLDLLRKKVMSLDFSWDRSANQYIGLYDSLKPE